MRAVLITGANGIVGSELARTLAREPDPPELRLLVRADDADELAAKSAWLRGWIGSARARVEILRGDVTRPDLGLDAGALASLLDGVTGVIHAAASTSFHQTEEQGERGNVVATRNVLDLARRCRRLERFGLVSTVYVAGCRTGDVREDELDLARGYSNEYERSKARAEIEALRADLPVAIYRLGIVVGRRGDGRISRMTGLYPVWRIFHQGLLSVLPGDMEQPIDLLPLDFAADATAHLFLRAFAPGARYHVTAGPARSMAMRELFAFAADVFGEHDPDWARRGYPLPASVDHDAFDAFADTTELVAHVSLRSVVRQLRTFAKQLAYPKRFDTSRLDAALAPSPHRLGHAREWLGPVLRAGCEAGWKTAGWEDMHGAR